jgi:UDP-N-acetylglucosamine 2-epimerase (non-hydrolysing)
MKILSIFGTRPEAIKMAPLLHQFQSMPEIESFVCVSGQHRHMLDPFIDLFKIKVDFDLNLMKPKQSLTEITTAVLVGVQEKIAQVKPDWVLVQGDTTTAFAAALAAFYEKIPVAHIEAGLRTHNYKMPWPEEMNRKLISSLADLHFAPTARAKENLLKEGIDPKQIFVTGNTVIDALFYTLKQTPRTFNWIDPKRRLILVTGHRRENFGEGLASICQALKNIASRKDVQIVYPVHLNPNVQGPVKAILGHLPNILLTEPLDYLDFVFLMHQSYLILTDSGGVQEEAPSLGKPVLVLREVTERPEAVEAGTVLVVGTDAALIEKETIRLLDDSIHYRKMAEAHNPYGDGHAAKRIAGHIIGAKR